jgi:hypothetical protein
MNVEGVPVDVIVEAIFFATNPDFPTPVIITLPLTADRIFIASVNFLLILLDSFFNAIASSFIIFFA